MADDFDWDAEATSYRRTVAAKNEAEPDKPTPVPPKGPAPAKSVSSPGVKAAAMPERAVPVPPSKMPQPPAKKPEPPMSPTGPKPSSAVKPTVAKPDRFACPLTVACVYCLGVHRVAERAYRETNV